MNYATQEKIRKNLYSGKINISRANNEARALYIKIIKRHMAELNKIIAQKYGIFNKGLFKGIFLALCSFLYGRLFYIDVYYPAVIVPAQEVGWSQVISDILVGFHAGWHIRGVSLEILISPLILALVLGFLAYKSFYEAWHVKENALSDLLRDEAVLVRLEKIK